MADCYKSSLLQKPNLLEKSERELKTPPSLEAQVHVHICV